MEKIIYENESGKMVANIEGNVINLTQYRKGESISKVSLFTEEIMELAELISNLEEDD